MTTSMLRWHLARDNCSRLAGFCEKNKVRSSQELNTAEVDGQRFWQMTYVFDNGGYITAELLHGDTRSYTVADHFQVVDYGLGSS